MSGLVRGVCQPSVAELREQLRRAEQAAVLRLRADLIELGWDLSRIAAECGKERDYVSRAIREGDDVVCPLICQLLGRGDAAPVGRREAV